MSHQQTRTFRLGMISVGEHRRRAYCCVSLAQVWSGLDVSMAVVVSIVSRNWPHRLPWLAVWLTSPASAWESACWSAIHGRLIARLPCSSVGSFLQYEPSLLKRLNPNSIEPEHKPERDCFR
jgi:hypothetical protein